MSKRIVKPADQLTIVEGVPMSNELTIQGFLLILKRRQATVFLGVAACLLLGVIASLLLKPRYKTIGEIEIQKSATDGLGLQNLTNPIQEDQPDALDASITLQTEATILQSTSLALEVIKDLNLENTQDFKPGFDPIAWAVGLLARSGGAPSDQPGAKLEDAPRRRDHAVKVFEKRLSIKPQSGSRLIDIQYTSSDPRIAAAVVNDVAKSLVDYTLNSRYTATSEVSSWLSGQLGDIKKEAELQQGKVEQLQRESGVYSLGISDAQGKEMAYSATLDRLQQATQELSTATSNRILKGALYMTVENGDPELISGLAGSTLAGNSPAVSNSFLLIQNLRTQQAALATQVAADTSKYGSANPRLADDRASLDSINVQIASEVKRIGERAANDFKASESVEDKTRVVYDKERQSADKQNDKAIALLIARQEASDARTLYQTLYSHLKEAGVVEGLRSSNISVVDAGRIPSRPVPDVPICLALSLVCGCFFGVSGALIADATSDRIETIAAIERTLNTPILAVLPMTEVRTLVKPLRGLTSGAHQLLADDNQASDGSRVAVLGSPNTAYVEALRGLRTSLVHSRDSSPPKTILITSAAEQEGKSTLSLNLAALLVLNGSRVLLIDGDMRSAGLSRSCGLRRQPAEMVEHEAGGLSNALSGSEPVVITPFRELPNLSVISAGPAPTYPAELLGSERMRALVQAWSSLYDYVLIDSPPVLAVADALILARFADTTLLVARHERSTQKSLERAYKTLNGVEETSVGVVVNGVNPNSVSFKEFYGYKITNYYKVA
jgi:capsular exopolysaccharide synthesis family protein